MSLIDIILPFGVNTVAVGDIPSLIANALYPHTESTARVISGLKKQLLIENGVLFPSKLHSLTSNPLYDYNTPETRLLEAVFGADLGEVSSMTDWAWLNYAWMDLPAFYLPLPESEWAQYAAAWAESSVELGWRPVPEWSTASLEALKFNMHTLTVHRGKLEQAIMSGELVPRSVITRLPEAPSHAEQIYAGFITVDEFSAYVARFHITVTVLNEDLLRERPSVNDEVMLVSQSAQIDIADQAQQEQECRHGFYTLPQAADLLAIESGMQQSVLLDKMVRATKAGKLVAWDPLSYLIEDDLGRINAKVLVTGDDINRWLASVRANYSFSEPENLNIPEPIKAGSIYPPRLRHQEDEILAWLKSNQFDPKHLPERPAGKSGPKKLARAALLKTHKRLFSYKSFDKAWQRLRDAKEIAGAK